MKNKILILGKGFIGSRLQQALQCDISSRKIVSYRDVDALIKQYRPRVLINCIGHIGSNVDECEEDKDKSLTANTFVPILLAEGAIRNKIKFVHTSSGCIFRYDYKKDKPVDENKVPDFFDLFYSRTKIYAERALEVLLSRYPILIVRLRVPLDNRPSARNLLDKLIRYGRVIDVPNSVTYIPDFIKATEHLLKIGACGIYNVANKGALRYPQLMKIYKKYVPGFRYEVIPYRRLKLVRTNLILSTRKLEKTGFKVRDIHSVLEECVREYVHAQK